MIDFDNIEKLIWKEKSKKKPEKKPTKIVKKDTRTQNTSRVKQR